MKTIHGQSAFSFDESGSWETTEPTRSQLRRRTESPFDPLPAPSVIQTQVILADPDLPLARSLTRSLKIAGYAVREARDGLDILTQVSPYILGQAPDPGPYLILAQAGLPGVTGLSVLAGNQAGVWRPKVVLMTSRAERANYHENLWIGASAILEKPFTEQQLLHAVTRVQPAWTRID